MAEISFLSKQQGMAYFEALVAICWVVCISTMMFTHWTSAIHTQNRMDQKMFSKLEMTVRFQSGVLRGSDFER